MRNFLLVIAAVTAFAANAQTSATWEKEPDNFLGIKFGQPFDIKNALKKER
jgi:hypothetical protein